MMGSSVALDNFMGALLGSFEGTVGAWIVRGA